MSATVKRLRLWLGIQFDRIKTECFLITHPARSTHSRDVGLTSERLARAVEMGSSFLRGSQKADGSFRGFLLPVGISDTWITAHATFVIENVAGLTDVRLKAAHYLSTTGGGRFGWGYNHRVRIDLDTSAQAIMVLLGHGLEIPAGLIDHVIAVQRNNGGFPTFPPSVRRIPIGWEVPHADVTLLVVEMLKRLDAHHSARCRALDWLHDQALKGRLHSYWWGTRSYILWAQAKAGFLPTAASAAARAMLQEKIEGQDLAMVLTPQINCGRIDGECDDAIQRLLSYQCEDGSWICNPCLRVTDIYEMTAGIVSKGAVYADPRRVFSTAHAVSVLSQIQLIFKR